MSPSSDAIVPESLAIIWIDWYAYHVARFRAIVESCAGMNIHGIELVGREGVHRGLLFRESGRENLLIETLLPEESWIGAGQFRLARLTWRKLGQIDPAVVFVPGYYTAPALAAALWARLHRRRTVLMTESTEQDHNRSAWKESAKSLLIRSLFGWAIAGGEPHVRYLRKLGFPMTRIGRFYNVVDNAFFISETDRMRAVSKPAAHGLPERYFLYVGRLADEKNVAGLLRAFSEYRNHGGDWDLVIVGEGPGSADLRALQERLGLDSGVHWMGLRANQGLASLYAFAGCFVLPSVREPWGLVVNEALASALPVIVSDRCGCVDDLVRPGVNGFLFDPLKPSDLAERLVAVDRLSTAERTAMGAASRQIISRYSPRAWAEEVRRIAFA